MTISLIQSSFTGGEWSPSLYTRTEQQKYSTAARKISNLVVNTSGSVSKRNGLEFVLNPLEELGYPESDTRSIPCRLIPFQFSTLQSYVLVLTHSGGLLVIKDGGVVATLTHPYTAGTDWEATQTILDAIKFTQSADVLYLTHPSYKPRKISRTSHTSWSISEITFGPALLPPNITYIPGGAFGYIVTSVSVEGFESEQALFIAAADRGETIQWANATGAAFYNVYRSDSWGLQGYYIGQVVAATWTGGINYFTEPAAGIIADTTKSPPESYKPFESAGNYPGVCTFFEQRLILGRTDNDPQTLWGSVIGDYQNFNRSRPVKADDSIEFTLSSNQVNEIKWFAAINDIIIGTTGGEWRASSGSRTDAITPTSIKLRQQSQWGCADIRPQIIGNTVLFIAGASDHVRDLAYAYDQDSYTGNDITLFARHLFQGFKVVDWSYQQYPESTLWLVRNDGKLIGCTYVREQDIISWHTHETNGLFKKVCTILTATGKTETYFVIERIINGLRRNYVERFKTGQPRAFDYLTNDYSGDYEVQDSFFVDSGLSYDQVFALASSAVVASGSEYVVRVLSYATHTISEGDNIAIEDMPELVASGFTTGLSQLNDQIFTAGTVVANATYSTIDIVTSFATTATSGFYSLGGKLREAVTNISGLTHLAGETITVLADGFVINDVVVSAGGTFALNAPALRVHAGYAFTSELETMDLSYPLKDGSVEDRIRSIPSVTLKVENTTSLSVGPNADMLTEIDFRTTEELGSPVQPYTGVKELAIDANNVGDARIVIQDKNPLPMTVTAIIARIENGN